MKITPEAVKERIAALEAAGETSLKEQFYLEALRLLVAAPDGEQLAIENFRSAMEGIGHIRRTLEETFGGLHGTHVEPDVLAECKAICDAIYAAYGRAQPAPVVPDERAAFNAWNNDIDCPLAGRDAKSAAWLAWNYRAMLQAAPVCTCPSGDGSLRWPCPVHPGNSPVVPDGIERVASMAEYLGNFAAAAIIRQLAANQPQNAQQNIPEIIPDSCTWTFSNYDDHWSGTCGAEWVFNDGGPEENGVKFCPKCGKSVAVSATEGTEE